MELGMVNKVVPLDELREEALTWARDIATLDPIMTRLVKRGINATIDAQGFSESLAHSFDIHELAHGIQASARAADPSKAREGSILEHMRATNKAISESQPASAQ
jgi:1,4-dihydroxy-2-naphthoyl-CoA synthase